MKKPLLGVTLTNNISVIQSQKKEIGTLFKEGSMGKLHLWEVTVLPGTRPMQYHFHDKMEISLVLEGSGYYTTEGSGYPISKGDMFVFSGNEIHCITNVGDDSLSLINMHFDSSLIDLIFGDSFIAVNNNFYHTHSNDFSNRIQSPTNRSLSLIYQRICEEFAEKRSEYERMVFLLFGQLIITLLRDYSYIDKSISVKPSALNTVSAMKEYIDRHITESFSLNDIAGTLGMNPSYLSSLFKRTCNIGLWDYILSKRISIAVKMISDTSDKKTMLEVALSSGFNNTANFNKAFKQQTGMTPKEFLNSDRLMI